MGMRKILYSLECSLRRKISRGTFLKFCLGWLLVLLTESRFLKAAFAEVTESGPRKKKTVATEHDLVVASGSDP